MIFLSSTLSLYSLISRKESWSHSILQLKFLFLVALIQLIINEVCTTIIAFVLLTINSTGIQCSLPKFTSLRYQKKQYQTWRLPLCNPSPGSGCQPPASIPPLGSTTPLLSGCTTVSHGTELVQSPPWPKGREKIFLHAYIYTTFHTHKPAAILSIFSVSVGHMMVMWCAWHCGS